MHEHVHGDGVHGGNREFDLASRSLVLLLPHGQAHHRRFFRWKRVKDARECNGHVVRASIFVRNVFYQMYNVVDVFEVEDRFPSLGRK
jgi:hypothetical protein